MDLWLLQHHMPYHAVLSLIHFYYVECTDKIHSYYKIMDW